MTEDAQKLATEKNLDDTADLVGEGLKIVEKAATKPLSLIQREALLDRIKGVKLAYDGRQFMAETAREFTLHEIAEPSSNSRGVFTRAAPLDEVIEKLEHEANIDATLIALGAPEMLMVSPDRESVGRAIEEREVLLHLLRKLDANLPPAPAKRGRGQPMARDLYFMVEWLADCWELWTGKEFKRLWGKGKPVADTMRFEPVTDAMRFTCAVVKAIDKDRLDELPTVTKNVRTDRRKRRKAASQGIWQRYAQENPKSAFWGPPPKIVVESKRCGGKRPKRLRRRKASNAQDTFQ